MADGESLAVWTGERARQCLHVAAWLALQSLPYVWRIGQRSDFDGALARRIVSPSFHESSELTSSVVISQHRSTAAIAVFLRARQSCPVTD